MAEPISKGGESYDIQTEHDLVVLVDKKIVSIVHLRTVEDHDPQQFRGTGGRGKYNIFINIINTPENFQNYIKQCIITKSS